MKTRICRAKQLDAEKCEFIKECISNDVSTSLRALKLKFQERYNVVVSTTTINKFLTDMHYSFKRIELIPEARNTTGMISGIEVYCSEYMLQDETKIIFIDEFRISCSTLINYGRSLVGTTPRKAVRSIRSKNISVCAAMMKSGIVSFTTREKTYNSCGFRDFLNEMITKLHNSGIMNGRVIMDNASIHKNVNHKNLLEENGFELKFLPAYTPQLNPIEEVFSKWKHYIKTGNPSRSIVMIIETHHF